MRTADEAEASARSLSEARLEEVFAASPIGLVWVALDGRFLRANPAFCSMVGWGESELLARGFQAITHPEDLNPSLKAIGELIDGSQQTCQVEKRYLTRDGRTVWAQLHISLLRDGLGRPVHFISQVLDITERRLSEDMLRRAEDRLRTMFDRAPVSIWEEDFSGVWAHFEALRASGVTDWRTYFDSHPEAVGECARLVRIVDVNQTSVAVSGAGSKTQLLRELANYFTDESLPVFKEELITLAEGGTSFESEVPIQNLQGESQTVWLALNIVPTDGPPLSRVLVSFADISQRKRTEQALRDSEARYRNLIERMPGIVYAFSNQRGGVFYSHRVKEILGFSHEQLCADPRLWQASVHPDDLPLVARAIQGADSGETFCIEYRIRNAQGQWRWLEDRSTAYNVEGAETIIEGYAIDVTEQKIAGEASARLEAQLQQAQKMESVGRLAGGVAHDFNNMLGVILGRTEIALEGLDPSSGLCADLEEIHSAATRSADLTRQLLAFARKQTVEPRVLDLNETVSGMLKMLQRLIGEEITLQWRPGADLWRVNVDPSQIDQILANLCVNARDAIGGVGTITIATSNGGAPAATGVDDPDEGVGDFVRLEIADDGCGMDPDTLRHVFEPFFTTKAVGVGTGLGLATVYGAVKQNGGFVTVDSSPGSGATFAVFLPRYAGDVQSPVDGREAGPTAPGSETILLVEDERSILKMTAAILRKRGYTVIEAMTPGEAIRLTLDYPGRIDLLMTDVVMPEMNGRTLAKHVLAINPRIKRLFMSGYSPDVVAHHGVVDEGVNFLRKPFSVADLAAAVRRALESA